jgi:hypothetical protein
MVYGMRAGVKKNIIIKWKNEKGYCKVVFCIHEEDDKEEKDLNMYLLVRKGEWTIDDKLLTIPQNQQYIVERDEGRKIWDTLVEKYGFEVLK